MTGYKFGRTRTHELHDAIRRAEQAERTAQELAVELDVARYSLRRRQTRVEVHMDATYLSTLTEQERRTRPTLRDGDTPETCRARLQAAADESWPIHRQRAA